MVDGETSAVAVSELQKLQDWLREPDHAEHFGTSQILEWINRRPTHIVPAAIARLTSPPQAASAEVRIPVEQLRGWYSAAWASWIETIADNDGEDNGSPTPQHLREMELALAAVPAHAPIGAGEVLAALKAERAKPLQGPEHGAWDRGRRYGLDDAIRIASALAAAPTGNADAGKGS